MEEKPCTLASGIHALAKEARNELGSPPTPEELRAYLEDRLTAGEKERIQDYIALFPECAELLMDMKSFPDIATSSEEWRISDQEMREARRRIQKELAAGKESPASVKTFRIKRFFKSLFARPWTPAWGLATAFALLLTCGLNLMLSLRNQELREAVRELSKPQAGVSLHHLTPDDEATMRSDAGDERTILVSREVDRLVLLLNPRVLQPYPDYRVEISDAASPEAGVLWQQERLRRSPDYNFALSIPRAFLKPGSYQIRLYGQGDRAEEPIAEYRVRIVHGSS